MSLTFCKTEHFIGRFVGIILYCIRRKVIEFFKIHWVNKHEYASLGNVYSLLNSQEGPWIVGWSESLCYPLTRLSRWFALKLAWCSANRGFFGQCRIGCVPLIFPKCFWDWHKGRGPSRRKNSRGWRINESTDQLFIYRMLSFQAAILFFCRQISEFDEIQERSCTIAFSYSVSSSRNLCGPRNDKKLSNGRISCNPI